MTKQFFYCLVNLLLYNALYSVNTPQTINAAHTPQFSSPARQVTFFEINEHNFNQLINEHFTKLDNLEAKIRAKIYKTKNAVNKINKNSKNALNPKDLDELRLYTRQATDLQRQTKNFIKQMKDFQEETYSQNSALLLAKKKEYNNSRANTEIKKNRLGILKDKIFLIKNPIVPLAEQSPAKNSAKKALHQFQIDAKRLAMGIKMETKADKKLLLDLSKFSDPMYEYENMGTQIGTIQAKSTELQKWYNLAMEKITPNRQKIQKTRYAPVRYSAYDTSDDDADGGDEASSSDEQNNSEEQIISISSSFETVPTDTENYQ